MIPCASDSGFKRLGGLEQCNNNSISGNEEWPRFEESNIWSWKGRNQDVASDVLSNWESNSEMDKRGEQKKNIYAEAVIKITGCHNTW